MKGIHLIFIFSIISQTLLFSQVVVKRNNQVSKELANVNWSKEYTLFDYTTDEPIFPLLRNGQSVYKIYYASKEDLRPNYGEFSIAQVEGLKYYKFKNRETCFKFCLANKLNAVPTLTTSSITGITTTTATSGGNITTDGGASITAKGIVWSTTTNPTIALTTKTSNGIGTGSFSSSLTNLTPKTTYYVRAYATNSAGTGYGNEISFTTTDSSSVMGIPCPGTPTVKDIDGNTYNTVQIGTQCWTKENLRVTKYRDGSIIPLDESGGVEGNGTSETWSSRTTGARTVYGHSASNLATYGYLYNWYAATDSKGLCPNGWHVPSDSEWTSLTTYLGGESVAGGKMKSTGTTLWSSPNTEATNESSFTVYPAGIRGNGFEQIGGASYFWSNSDYNGFAAYNRVLQASTTILIRQPNEHVYSAWFQTGASVRCLRDTNSSVSVPSLITTTITAITTTSATSGGNITTDGGTSITARGVVWSTTANPTIALTTKTSNGTGNGSFSSTLTNLTPKSTYYVRAYATNSAGTGYGIEISFTTSDSTNVMGVPCPGTPTVKDIDGNTYNTVQIGTQCWTKENLRVTKYRDGSLIPLDESGGTSGDGTGQTWSSRTTGARTVYGHSASNLAAYGYLYNWYAAADSKGLCPIGWHVPSDSEWTTLTTYLGGESVAGDKMKTIGTSNWDSSSPGANNSSGFSALPGSTRSSGDGSFCCIGYYAFFWSATEEDNTSAWQRFLISIYSQADRGKSTGKSIGASVRCLKDTFSIVSIPTLTTTAITAITTSSATSGGNITAVGGASITARGVVWSTSTNPTIALTTKTTDGSGTGSFTSSLTNLTPKTTYYLRAYATNSSGTAYGNEITFTTTDSSIVMGIPCPGTPTVKDIDGNTYNTVQIGTQCWTKENLRVTKYRDGTVIPLDESGGTNGDGTGQTWSSRTTGARTVYGHNATNLATYGYLYNWYAATDSKGLCPSGWNIPSETDWQSLADYLGINNGDKLRDTIWWIPSVKSSNESGLSVKPGGYRDTSRFSNESNSGNFWSSSKKSDIIWNETENLGLALWYKGNLEKKYTRYDISGLSMRCIKLSDSNISLPSLSTSSAISISINSAISGGTIYSDGGSPVTSRGVVWSNNPNPTTSLSTKTTDYKGTGSFVSSINNLKSNTTYYLRAYASNIIGTIYGNEIIFSTQDSVMNIPCPGTPTVKDIDGNTYNTVKIGFQCWMKENLKVTKYREGTTIPLDDSGGSTGNGSGQIWSSRSTGTRTIYGHDTSNLKNYGYLYNWYAVADGKGLCPSGWHVPNNEDWSNLTAYLAGQDFAGGKMKATGFNDWKSSNMGGTNESGFSALPGGYRYYIGGFYSIKERSFFWSFNELGNINAWILQLNYNETNTKRYDFIKGSGVSVRCIKDINSIVSIPSLTTTAITANTATSATSGGNITSDGGASISARGVVWSTSTNPTIALTTKTSDGIGTGSFSSFLTSLAPKTTYYVRAYATNSAGTAYGNEISFTTSDSTNVMGIPCPGTPTVKDVDGNTYNTVQIGTQCWTKENLRVTKYRDGTIIPLDESGGTIGDEFGEKWSIQYEGARTVLGHSASNLATYGYLYNWYAIKNQKGICPDGWHPPNNREWNILNEFLGGEFISGNKLKDTIWRNITPDNISTNESGFSALPGGWRTSTGFFPSSNRPDREGIFWSLSDTIDFYEFAWYRKLVPTNIGNRFISEKQSKFAGFSVRCLKDSPTIVSIPTLTTTTVTSITNTSATSGGNITTDGGASISARGVVWSTSTNSTIALTTKTSNGTGSGSFISTLTNLTPKTTYYVRAYATNSAGTAYGNEISFTTSDSTNVMGIPCPGTPTVKDIDGNTYNTVQIGTQCWTKENLRVTMYRDGSIIPLDESGGVNGHGTGQTWSSRTRGARTVYEHRPSNLAIYGYLYNWYSVADTKELCPSGWHVPSDAEWTNLTTYLGESVAGGKLKSTGTTFWYSPNTGGINENGFSAFPGGRRYGSGSFGNVRDNAFFWSTTEYDNGFDGAWYHSLSSGSGTVERSPDFKSFGASVRCLRD